MKQKSFWHKTKVVSRNLVRIFKALTCYFTVELMFRVKWLYKDLTALFQGYSSHRSKLQHQLDHNQRIYSMMKQCPEGYWGTDNKPHSWSDMMLF